MKFPATLLMLLASTAVAIPLASPGWQGYDFGSLQNKVRCGAVAVANQDSPRSGRIEHVSFQNGDQLDATVLDDRKRIAPTEELHDYAGPMADIDEEDEEEEEYAA